MLKIKKNYWILLEFLLWRTRIQALVKIFWVLIMSYYTYAEMGNIFMSKVRMFYVYGFEIYYANNS